MLVMLSIIIPTYNEIKHGYLTKIIPDLINLPDTEIICVDSGSNDGTREYITSMNIAIYDSKSMTRANRMNIGIANATGSTVLLYHPRILIDINGIKDIIKNPPATWGGFFHKFTSPQKLLKFISWYSNKVRLLKKSIVYLDHGIYINKKLADKVFPIPDEPIFEDTILSRRLASHKKPTLNKHIAWVSPVRFEKNGPLKQFLSNQVLKGLFALGVSPTKLNNWYERDLHLNGKSNP